MSQPVEVNAVHYHTAHLCGQSVHIFRGGVGDDVGAPFKRPAVHGRGESIVHDEGHPVLVGNLSEALDVENGTARVRDGLAEECFRVRTEGGLNLLVAGFLRDKRTLDAEFFQRHTEEVVGTAVDFVGGDEVVAGLTDVEDGVEVGGLTRGGQHSPHTAFQCGNLRCYRIVRRVLQAGIEIALLFEVKQLRHLVRVVVLEGCRLDDRQLYRFSVFGLIPCMYAERALSQFLVHFACQFINLTAKLRISERKTKIYRDIILSETVFLVITGTCSLILRTASVEVVTEGEPHTLRIGIVILSRLADGVVGGHLGLGGAEYVVGIECSRQLSLQE